MARNTIITAGLVIAQVLTTYFLRSKILDLVSRIVQGLNAPLDYVISRLEKTQSSIIRLNFRQRVLNLVLVLISFVMLFSEAGTLREILNATASNDPIHIWRFQVTAGEFASIAYLTIATILGFMSLEILEVRDLFDGIFFNEPEKPQPNSRNTVFDKTSFRRFIAFSLLVILVVLALFQGILGVQRFQLSSKDTTVARLNGSYALPAFYFTLGFLTPIIAGFALLSFDIFLALVAKFVIGVLLFIEKMLAVIYMAFEVVIQVIASPVEKLLEFFAIYQPKNINETNKNNVKPAVRSAPLENNEPVYLENKSAIYRMYTSFRKHGAALMFLADNYGINFSVPSEDHKISKDTQFSELVDHLKSTYQGFTGKEIQFKYINNEGNINQIPLTDKVSDYLRLTDTIIVDAYSAPQAPMA